MNRADGALVHQGMRTGIRHLSLAAAALAVLPAITALAAPGWKLVPAPSPGSGVFNAFLTSITQITNKDAWAVGTDNGRPLIEHWNGLRWSVAALPKLPGASASLAGVSAHGPSDVWAVGQTLNSEGVDGRTLALHWNGQRWTVAPTPSFSVTPGSSSGLASVVTISATDAWAVGTGLNNDANELIGLIEHWNGTRWQEVTSPSPLNRSQWLTGVAADGSNHVWAVGVDDTTLTAQTLTMRLSGSQWQIVPSPSVQAGQPQNDLAAVTVAGPADVWAAGMQANVGNQNFRKPLLLHWTGSAWHLVSAPNLGTEGSGLFGVAALSPADVWAVGETYQAAVGAPFLTYALHWTGKSWVRVATPNGPNAHGISNLSGVSGQAGHGVWAVGTATPATGCCERVLTARDLSG